MARPKAEAKALSVTDLKTVREAVRSWMAQARPGPKVFNDMADIVDVILATGARTGEGSRAAVG